MTVNNSANNNASINFESEIGNAGQSNAQHQEQEQLKLELTRKVNNFASKKKIRSSFARDSIVLDIGDIE